MLKMLPLIIAILFGITAIANASPCSDALTKYSQKLPNFNCSDNEKNDDIQDRLVNLFKRKSAKRKAELAKKPKVKFTPDDVDHIEPIKVVKDKSYKTEVPMLQLLKFNKGWE